MTTAALVVAARAAEARSVTKGHVDIPAELRARLVVTSAVVSAPVETVIVTSGA